jgi:adenylate cyclase
MPGVSDEAAELFEGLDDDRRAARERLLARLRDDGFSDEELRAAAAEDRLALLPVERVLGARYTASEIEERTGVPAGLIVRVRQLLGLPKPGPEDRAFSDDDIETAQSIKLFLDTGFTEDEIAGITRVLGEGMSRLAATTTAAFVRTFLEAGDDEDAVAERFASMTAELVPAVRPILVGAFNAHLRDGVRRGILGREELEAGQIQDSVEAAVCFADLVGFTRLGGEVEPEELGSVAGGLAAIANEVVKPPVRLIKTIGDAAMFVSPEPAPLVAVALSLVEAVQAADLPALRAGIAFGPALLRAGDFYGHSVNLASRVTGIARPESVLCTTEVHDAAAEQFEWSFAGKHRLKGIPDRVSLYRAHRIEAPAQESEAESDDGKPAKVRRATPKRSRRRERTTDG